MISTGPHSLLEDMMAADAPLLRGILAVIEFYRGVFLAESVPRALLIAVKAAAVGGVSATARIRRSLF